MVIQRGIEAGQLQYPARIRGAHAAQRRCNEDASSPLTRRFSLDRSASIDRWAIVVTKSRSVCNRACYGCDSRYKQNQRFSAPEADLGNEKFNWCPVTIAGYVL